MHVTCIYYKLPVTEKTHMHTQSRHAHAHVYIYTLYKYYGCLHVHQGLSCCSICSMTAGPSPWHIHTHTYIQLQKHTCTHTYMHNTNAHYCTRSSISSIIQARSMAQMPCCHALMLTLKLSLFIKTVHKTKIHYPIYHLPLL
jgi:hypothetical protein